MLLLTPGSAGASTLLLTPGGAGAGAFASIAFPFAGIAGARFAVLFDRATRREHLAAVFARALGFEDALAILIPNVIVSALAT